MHGGSDNDSGYAPWRIQLLTLKVQLLKQVGKLHDTPGPNC